MVISGGRFTPSGSRSAVVWPWIRIGVGAGLADHLDEFQAVEFGRNTQTLQLAALSSVADQKVLKPENLFKGLRAQTRQLTGFEIKSEFSLVTNRATCRSWTCSKQEADETQAPYRHVPCGDQRP